MTYLFEADIIEQHFGERLVLQNIHLRLQPGEVVTLVGPSGCGKSTLLRIIAGLERNFRGSLQLRGQPHQGLNRDIGLIFQEPRLLPWLNVAANVAFDLGQGGSATPRVAELLDEVGLSGYQAALPKQLSGGQAQRVALARGLFTQPKLLLLDEPFSAVDAFTRMKLQDLLLGIARHHAITLLLVTHDVEEAAYLSDRIIVMRDAASGLSGEFPVRAPRPRDRRDPELAETKAQVLTALYEAHAI